MKYLSLILLFISLRSFASHFKAPVTFSATTTSAQALAENKWRDYLIIVNNGSVPIYVKTGSAHSGTEGVTIVAGGNWEPFKAPQEAIYIKASSGTVSTTLVEGNE